MTREAEGGKLCTTCFLYLQENGTMRPHKAVHHSVRRKCPPEMAPIVCEFRRFAHIVAEQKDPLLKNDDPKQIYLGRKHIVDEDLRKMQKSMLEIRSTIARSERQMTNFEFRRKDPEVDRYKKMAASLSRQRPASRIREQWTDREMTIAFHLLLVRGSNHSRIAAFLRTKTAAQVREFAEKYSQELQEAGIKQETVQEEHDLDEPPVLTAEGDMSKGEPLVNGHCTV
ncbi:hypothetical protein QR680_006910 [Steinernema hermaphroditum]|uniref:GATA-type domain-containing protein n=1 Tax=Steinernema hermaphroditum TaxID=289476 RepID=A0AA39LXV8_9BILA|nr:hypothetical protein QR680_006910 [Steinernema hermaphroditum]